MFDAVDANHDDSLSRDEVIDLFGGSAVVMLKHLLSDDLHYGSVSHKEYPPPALASP